MIYIVHEIIVEKKSILKLTRDLYKLEKYYQHIVYCHYLLKYIEYRYKIVYCMTLSSTLNKIPLGCISEMVCSDCCSVDTRPA